MTKVNDLLLISGEPIYLEDHAVKVKQPSIKEIASIGEELFFQSLSVFSLNSEPFKVFIQRLEDISQEEKLYMIDNISDFDNFIFFMNMSEIDELKKQFDTKKLATTIFELVLPDFTLNFISEGSLVILKSNVEDSHSIVVDREFFADLKSVLSQIFMFDKLFENEADTNMSPGAQKIAEKMRKAEEKIRKIKGETGDESYFARILSIMGVKKELEYLKSLTVYQLINQFEREQLYANYQQGIQALVAGATDVEVEDWYKKL